jgi:hypothetical protein
VVASRKGLGHRSGERHLESEARRQALTRTIGREYAIGWGTLALINAGLAQAKRRSGLAWFLASLLLGPIATFLIVVLDPNP